MRIGLGIDIHEYDDKLIHKFEIVNLENPLYPKYLFEKIEKVEFRSNHEVIVDGVYIDINPAVEEPDILEIVKKRVQESIDFAMYYNATEIIFLSTFISDIGLKAYDDKWLENSARFWKDICERNNRIRISICNTFECNPDILIELVEKVNKEKFGLAMDIGHSLLYSDIGIDQWFKKVKSYINTVYIHSNNKVGDEHLGLNKGMLLENDGFRKIIRELKEKKMILKIFNKGDIVPSIDILRGL